MHKTEPYIYSQFSHGPDAPEYGRGAYHWMTGTAAWMFRSVLDYMLGIQPKREGIEVNPCINDEWDYYEVTRPFRNAVYNFKVHNPNHKETGVEYIVVDGVRIDGNYIEYHGESGEHTVEVYM